MPRNTAKANPTQQIADAIATEPDFEFDDIAQRLGISEPNLRDRLEAKLGNSQVQRWELLPREHQPTIDQIAKDLEVERSVRVLPQEIKAEEPVSPTTEPEASEEPPAKKKRKSALTQKKRGAIADNRETSTQTSAGIEQTLKIIEAQAGAQLGAELGTTYLHAMLANQTNVKGQGLTVIVAQKLQQMSQRSGFDPNELLTQIGVPLSSETQEMLNSVMGQALGKAQEVTQEVTQTGWGNGFNLQDELLNLENLTNLSD